MSSSHSSHHSPAPSGNDTYERTDLPTRPIKLAMVIGGIVLVLVFVAMWGLTELLGRHEASVSPPANPLAASAGRKEPPAPRLQTDPAKDIAALHALEDAKLNNYAWIDKQAGTVRIPISRALDLVAERGLPSRAQGAHE